MEEWHPDGTQIFISNMRKTAMVYILKRKKMQSTQRKMVIQEARLLERCS